MTIKLDHFRCPGPVVVLYRYHPDVAKRLGIKKSNPWYRWKSFESEAERDAYLVQMEGHPIYEFSEAE
jgi:hypothetical protein